MFGKECIMIIESGSRLVMIGDSITDCGRDRAVRGEGTPEVLGSGYVSFVSSVLGAKYPELGIGVINMGIGGNTVRDLDGRWQEDLLDLKPDWVSIMIGINDVWQQSGPPDPSRNCVTISEYETTLTALVEKTLPGLKGMILMTPYHVEPDRKNPMRSMMDDYGVVVRGLAGKHSTVFVDTQAAFDRYLEHHPPGSLAGDQIHVNAIGHMILALAWLEAVGV
jgi:lysophospholipase L1-like esterase